MNQEDKSDREQAEEREESALSRALRVIAADNASDNPNFSFVPVAETPASEDEPRYWREKYLDRICPKVK